MPPNKKPPFAPSDLDRFLLCCGERWAGGRCRKCGNGGDSPPAPPSRPSQPSNAPPRPARAQRGGKLPAGSKMNKGEDRVFQYLKSINPGCLVIPHGIRIAFPDFTHYLPDVTVYPPQGECRKILLVEVKGKYFGPGREQGIERFRRARDVFRHWFDFKMIDPDSLEEMCKDVKFS